MKLKVLFLSTAILTVAALFTFCTKETPVTETVQTANTEQEEAGSRALCQVKVKALGGCLNVCGTQTTPTPCGNIGGVILTGSTMIPINTEQTFFINSPASLLISRGPCAAGQLVTALVTTDQPDQFAYAIPFFGNVQVNVDATCGL